MNTDAHLAAVQSETERNEAVVDEYFKAGVPYCQVLPTCSISLGSAPTTTWPRTATSWRYSTSALLARTRSSRSLTIGRSGTARPPRLWAAYFEPQAVLEALGIK